MAGIDLRAPSTSGTSGAASPVTVATTVSTAEAPLDVALVPPLDVDGWAYRSGDPAWPSWMTADGGATAVPGGIYIVDLDVELTFPTAPTTGFVRVEFLVFDDVAYPGGMSLTLWDIKAEDIAAADDYGDILLERVVVIPSDVAANKLRLRLSAHGIDNAVQFGWGSIQLVSLALDPT